MRRWLLPCASPPRSRARPLYPIEATGYGLRVMLQLFMWIALAQSWNLISGLTGYVSFGHVAFFGMGAYTAGDPHRRPAAGRGRSPASPAA